ncbi:hypothetical protein DFH08DRAFT_783065 [Mycena albidolilacea]|uniref:Uncharacterized protein n=1 Tax=Mycena albidolilacea TaxID=1033008 RepID=A0AAD6ZVX2_9AGAR|nr:hypothetical protein DFH08DRAFT_783065 [Mycena albidolilacea]
MFRRYSYVPHRRLFYGLIWAIAAAELGLTAARIHFTRSNFRNHEAIVAELLVTSILTLFWVPLTLLFHRRAPGIENVHRIDNVHNNIDGNIRGNRNRFGGLHHESSGNLVLWIMWLVGAAIAAHRWPTRGAVGFGRQPDILIALIALAFVEFGLMTLVKVLALMEYSALGASGLGGPGVGGRVEKNGVVPGVVPGPNTAATGQAPVV